MAPRMTAAELKFACQQLLDEVRKVFPTEPPSLTLIEGGADTATRAETNEERSARLGFTYTDEHRAIEGAADCLEASSASLHRRGTLTVVPDGSDAA